MDDVAEEPNFKFYLILIVHHLHLNLRMWQVAAMLESVSTEAEPSDNLTGLFHKSLSFAFKSSRGLG